MEPFTTPSVSRFMDTLLREFRFAVRALTRDKGFSATTIFTLAISVAASAALFLAAVGIYGVLAYLVAQRRREIGIRVALGSTQAGIAKLIRREGVVLSGAGLLLGLAASAALRSAIESQVYGVTALDPRVLGAAAVLLCAIALVACAAPTRRAMRVDPASVLSQQ